MYLVPYMIKFPQLLWNEDSSLEESKLSCTVKEIWSMKGHPNYLFDNASSSTFNNWITNLNLLCVSDFEVGLFGSIYIAGYVFGALTLLRLGDIFGRKKTLLYFCSMNLLLFWALYFVRNVKIIYALLFACGAIRIWISQLTYILMVELQR